MAKIISTDEQLRSHIPNLIVSVKGETPLFDKVSLYLDLAEDWVRNTFTSDASFNTIVGYTASNPTRVLTERLVVAEAMRRAIPSLDIVLTPNGFGVVSTQNLAPASKPRVDRLVGSMLSHRDDCIAALLPALVGASKWLTSSQAQFFGSTLFPTLDIVDAVGTPQGSKWDKYVELRSQIIYLEASLAEEYFSPELMNALRSENLRGTASGCRAIAVEQIKAQLISYLKGGSFNSRRLVDIVNYIRQNENDFSEWHQSETAKLFAPPIFKNTKQSSGYWF